MSLRPLSLEKECIFVRLSRQNLPCSLQFLFEIWVLSVESFKKHFNILQQSLVAFERQILFDFVNFFALIYLSI